MLLQFLQRPKIVMCIEEKAIEFKLYKVCTLLESNWSTVRKKYFQLFDCFPANNQSSPLHTRLLAPCGVYPIFEFTGFD